MSPPANPVRILHRYGEEAAAPQALSPEPPQDEEKIASVAITASHSDECNRITWTAIGEPMQVILQTNLGVFELRSWRVSFARHFTTFLERLPLAAGVSVENFSIPFSRLGLLDVALKDRGSFSLQVKCRLGSGYVSTARCCGLFVESFSFAQASDIVICQFNAKLRDADLVLETTNGALCSEVQITDDSRGRRLLRES
jgi:hypothetical protein